MRFYRDARVVALAALVSCAAGQAGAQVAMPIVAGPTVLIGRAVHVTVLNTSNRPITAWGIRGRITLEDGSVQAVGAFVDTDDLASPDTAFRAALAPGATRQNPMGPAVRIGTITAIVVEASFVVFDDDTVVGEDPVIDMLFWARSKNLRAWRVIDDLLAETEGAEEGSADVLGLLESVLTVIADDEVRGTKVYRLFLGDVRRAARAVQAPDADPVALLAALREAVHAQRASVDRRYR
jgi:hypothetical protein